MTDVEHVQPAHSVLADERYARALLADAVGELASGTWRLESWRLRDLRGGRRKPVALYDLTYANGAGDGTHVAEVAVKVFRAKRHRALVAHEAATSLWADGMRPPSPLRVPRPLGYCARRSAVVSEVGAGTPWADFLSADDAALAAASRRAAAWLSRLQAARMRPAPGEGVEDRVRVQVRELGRAHPGHRRRLEGLLERLGPRLAPPGPAVPSHGDFHPKNVLLTDELTTGIDLDAFALREPAHDVGWAIGQLASMAHFRLGDARRGAEAGAAFWREYAESGTAPWPRVAAHVARTHLDVLHYVVYALDTGERALLDAWPDLIEAWLDSTGPQTLDDLCREAP